MFSVGCTLLAPRPTEQVALGDVLLRESFDQPYAWERYANDQLGVDFRVEQGVYRAFAREGGFMWGLNSTIHTDVVIQVDTEQLSTAKNNAYGVMCRASPSDNGDGYYFLISGDGYFTLRSGARGSVGALIEWTETGAIQQGQSINRIRAVCIGDYLALYVNGEFVGETRDTRYTRGYAGLVAAIPEGEGEVDIAFDALTIWSATLIPRLE